MNRHLKQTHYDLPFIHAHDLKDPNTGDVVFIIAGERGEDRLYASKRILRLNEYFAARNMEIQDIR